MQVSIAQIVEFVTKHWELVLIWFGIAAVLGYDFIAGNAGSLDPLEAVNVINHQEGVVVDVRPTADFVRGHIIHALNVPLNNLTKQINMLEKHKEQPLILNCDSGARSAQACKQLRSNGFTKVYNLRGGILAWESAGLPITRKSR